MVPARHQGMETGKVEDDSACILVDFGDQSRRALDWRSDSRQAFFRRRARELRGARPHTSH